MPDFQRKHWIDNLRWTTILLVVVFHVFFYYNNIGIEPMFKKLTANPLSDDQQAVFTIAGLFQYAVYQWFMLLLFVVSGICAKCTLQRKTVKEFLKNRTQKLLVPSTLGIITIQWISGYLNMLEFQTPEMQTIPLFVKYIICVFSGTGALWFCQVLFLACVILVGIKKLDKNSRFENLCRNSNILVAILLYFLLFAASQILNIPKITSYRLGYYVVAFLIGYYVFSNSKLLEQLKQFRWILFAIGTVSGVFYVQKFYGTYYADYSVLNDWLSIFHAWFTCLGILGIAQTALNFNNRFCDYMNRTSWGIYINHIIVLQLTNILLKPIAPELPITVIYAIEFVSGVAVSIILWELLSRIPLIRYLLYGKKKQ